MLDKKVLIYVGVTAAVLYYVNHSNILENQTVPAGGMSFPASIPGGWITVLGALSGAFYFARK